MKQRPGPSVRLLTGTAGTQGPLLHFDSAKEKVFPNWRAEKKGAVTLEQLGGFSDRERRADRALVTAQRTAH